MKESDELQSRLQKTNEALSSIKQCGQNLKKFEDACSELIKALELSGPDEEELLKTMVLNRTFHEEDFSIEDALLTAFTQLDSFCSALEEYCLAQGYYNYKQGGELEVLLRIRFGQDGFTKVIDHYFT
ncbi:hypothetical protein ACPV5U_19210 [Vibrio mediterranei]